MRLHARAWLWFLATTTVLCRGESDRVAYLVRIFSKCSRSDRVNFDRCMETALNEIRPLFKGGVPELNISSFDPFYAEEVIQRLGDSDLGYNLTLRNVYESGWTNSLVTKFWSDLTGGVIRYHQWFPEKFLRGEWEMSSNFVGAYSNSGTFDLALYNYTQVTTVKRSKRDPNLSFTVRVEAKDCEHLELHISNLLKGRRTMEQILDRLINRGWRPGFYFLRPFIDDLVSTAFTKIFNDNLGHFPFDTIIPD